MCVLAIETATSAGSLAILRDEKVIFQDYININVALSETIMARIDSALKFLKIDKKEFKAVCISNGPGSFTSLRIGLSTAKGIATGLKIPLIAFNTLEILASNTFGTEKKIFSILDARMNEAYVSIFDSKLNTILAAHCRSYNRLLDDIEGDYICVGDTDLMLPTYKPASKKEGSLIESNSLLHFALPHQNLLLAASQFSLLKYNNIKLKYDEEYIHKLEPFYIRSSNSQVSNVLPKKLS